MNPAPPVTRYEDIEKTSQRSRKPNSVPTFARRPFGRRAPAGDDHSSSLAIAGEVQRPTRGRRTGRPNQRPKSPDAPLFGLAPCGVLPATNLTAGAVRSYRTFSPLPTVAREVREGGRYIFCATFLQVALTGRYPAHCPAEFGLSSHLAAGGRLARCEGLIVQARHG